MRFFAATVVVAGWASFLSAQPPARPPLTRPLYSSIMEETSKLRPLETVTPGQQQPQPLRIDAPVAFDTASLRLKTVSGQWQLWAGNQLLKDFGTNQKDAYEALQVFRDLRLDARGSVGGVFEYYLTNNAAPTVGLKGKQVVPFDLAGLRVEQVSGQWVLRDARIILYNFGQSQSDARQALAVCRQYGFNQIGVVGHPVPSFKYLLKDPNPPPAWSNAPGAIPVSARMQAVEVPRRQLYVPGFGAVGMIVPLDYRRLDLRRDAGEWVLYEGKNALGRFGPYDRDARAALEILQDFHCSEVCRFGSDGFGFALDNGRAPRGTLVGLTARMFYPERLTVKSIDDHWLIADGGHPLFHFGKEKSAAREALAAIRHFRFDTYCPIGAGHLGDLYLMMKR